MGITCIKELQLKENFNDYKFLLIIYEFTKHVVNRNKILDNPTSDTNL